MTACAASLPLTFVAAPKLTAESGRFVGPDQEQRPAARVLAIGLIIGSLGYIVVLGVPNIG